MSYNLYLGDIDPNLQMSEALKVRREIFFKLLLWDSVVLSDSQLLTDPRIIRLMSGFTVHKGEMADHSPIKGWHKGFEQLLESGLVQVAHRASNGREQAMAEVWAGMNAKGNANVPFLPKNEKYARYLDGLSHEKRVYQLSDMANRFKNNLNDGVEKNAILLRPDNDVDRELKRMFEEDLVLFRNIHAFIDRCLRDGLIHEGRHREIYDYVYSCYSTNVSAETDCFVSTTFKSLPFHLPLGVETPDGPPVELDPARMRPTWVLSPQCMDLLSAEGFLRVRRAVEPCIKSELLIKKNTGELEQGALNEYYDVWAEYTEKLEEAILQELTQSNMELSRPMEQAYLSQYNLKKQLTDLIVTASGFIPVLGTAMDVGDVVKNSVQLMVMLNKRSAAKCAAEHKQALQQYINDIAMKKTSVVTRY